MTTGGSALLLLALAVSAEGAPQLVLRTEAVVDRPQLRVSDLFDTGSLPDEVRERTDALVIATMLRGTERLSIDADTLAARIELLMPSLRIAPSPLSPAQVRVRLSRAPEQARERAMCLRVIKPIPAGEHPTTADFQQVACEHGERAFRYDVGTRNVRTERALSPGELVAAPPATALPDLRAGDTLFLSARVGPVAVEREVTVARPARFGRSVAVRAADGELFVVPAPKDGK